MKKTLFIITLLAVSVLTGNAGGKNFTVVLDPGHGGSDPGAVRAGVYESEINLAIALLVGEMLTSNHKDIDVVYTRKDMERTDKKLTSVDRMSIANAANGDIFVSIHTNSAYSEKTKKDVPSSYGVEVYIQTVENSARKKQTLLQKGSVISIGEHDEEISRKYDPSIAQFNAIYEIKQAQILNLSNNLAKYISTAMGMNRNNRGILQKSLYVTWQTPTPSVLIEVGYITNPEERAFMTSENGQKILAQGICNGIIAYKNDFDMSKAPLVVTSAPEQPQNIQSAEVNTVEKQEPEKADKSGEIVFKWQVLTSSTPLNDGDYRFNGLECSFYKQGNLYKYTYGESTDYKEIDAMRTKVKKLFPDAFIITMKDGKRLTN